jgi:hypothetical protein
VTVANREHCAKQNSPKFSTIGGMQIEMSDAQSKNAFDSMRRSFEPLSQVTTDRFSQESKHRDLSAATRHGMQIDASEVHSQNSEFPNFGLRSEQLRSHIQRCTRRDRQWRPATITEAMARETCGSSRNQESESAEQFRNAASPIREWPDPESNVTWSRRPQS